MGIFSCNNDVRGGGQIWLLKRLQTKQQVRKSQQRHREYCAMVVSVKLLKALLEARFRKEEKVSNLGKPA
jgi:hypothetical protein